MSLATVTVTLLLAYTCHCTVQDTDMRYQNSISALLTPSLCQLKLICAISQSRDHSLKQSDFMRGISDLSGYKGNRTVALMLEQAIKTGDTGGSCKSIAPACEHSAKELLQALGDMGLTDRHKHRVKRQAYERSYQQYSPYTQYSPYRRVQPWSQAQTSYSPFRRQGLSLSNMPPIFRPDLAGRRRVCRTCDQRSTVCTVYSVGTYAGCTGVWLVAGIPGQLACNVATAPGSIGCGMNTLHCYMSGCGLINLPRLP